MANKSNTRVVRTLQKRTLTQQTMTAISGLFRKTPKIAPTAAPAPAVKASPIVDHSADTATLRTLLTLPASADRDERLCQFAAQVSSADLRWQAAQAVSTLNGWLALQKDPAPRDRRVAKWVKDQIATTKAAQQSTHAWRDLAAGYASLLQSAAVDVRHFMELDKAFDAALAQHHFDAQVQDQVAQWRASLQTRLQTQNEAQRQVQHMRDALKTILEAAQRGEYSAPLQVQLDTIIAAQPGLPPANGVFALSRLHTEISALIPTASAALAHAAQSADRLHTAQTWVSKAQQYAALSPNAIDTAGLNTLKKSWPAGLAGYAEHKTAFDAAIAQAASVLDAHKAKLAARHEQSMTWLTATQAALAAALDAGQGQEAVRLAAAISEQAGKTFDPKRLPSEQAAAIERLLAQARETRGLLHEGAVLERDNLLAKVQALAAKPLLGKYQEQALKELTDAWKTLSTKAGAAPTAVFKQFKAACDEAYAPVKAHKNAMRSVLAQGTAQRQAQIDELNALLARVDWQTVDWAAVEQLRNEARNAWRTSLPTEYKSRDALTQAHDAAMALLNTKLQGARDAELARRDALTQAALALETQPFAEQHSGARSLLERYNAERTGVYLPRAAEQAAWARFKAAIDTVYTRRDSERKAEASENAQALTDLITSKQHVLATLQAALHTHAADPKALQAAQNKALSAWDEPGRLPRNVGQHNGVHIDALVKDWLSAQEAVKTALNSAARNAQTQRTALAWQLAHALDAGSDSDALWNLASADGTLKKAFATRVQTTNHTANPAKAAALLNEALIDAEIATGTPTPEAHKSARLQRQVQKLSDKLTGNAQAAQNAGFNAWLTALVQAGSTQGEAGQRLEAVKAALGNGHTNA